MQPKFDAAYQGKHEPFKKCLKAARDYLGSLLAETWRHLSPDYLDYGKIANALLDADERLTGGEHAETVRSCFRWRQISVADGALALRRFSIEDCRPPASGRQRRVRSHPMARFAADGDAGSLDELLGSRVHDYCRSPDHDKSFIGLGPTYKQFKKMTLAEFTLHTTNFPTSGERDLALDQFATGLNDWLRGYGYVPSPGAKGAVREVAKSKESTVLQLLAAVQSNYSL